jgi:hypothetical protein
MILSSRQSGGMLYDEDEKEDPITGGPRVKNWLSKIGAAFGGVEPEEKASAKAASAKAVSEIEVSEVIKHHQKMSSTLVDEEAVMPSEQKRGDSLPHVNKASLINSGHGSDKEVLVRDYYLFFLFMMYFWFVLA